MNEELIKKVMEDKLDDIFRDMSKYTKEEIKEMQIYVVRDNAMKSNKELANKLRIKEQRVSEIRKEIETGNNAYENRKAEIKKYQRDLRFPCLNVDDEVDMIIKGSNTIRDKSVIGNKLKIDLLDIDKKILYYIEKSKEFRYIDKSKMKEIISELNNLYKNIKELIRRCKLKKK